MVSYLVLILSVIGALIVGGTVGMFAVALMIAAKDEDRSESESDCE